MIVCILMFIDGVGDFLINDVISLIGMLVSLCIIRKEIIIVVFFGVVINIIGMLIVVDKRIIMFVRNYW